MSERELEYFKEEDNLQLSKEAKALRAAYYKKWRDGNKDKVQASQARYWNKKAKDLQG